MSFRKAWARTFLNGEFDPHYLGLGYIAPDRCPDHSGCFRCRDESLSIPETAGNWTMKSPMDLASEMPGGTKRKLLTIGAKSMYDGKKGWGGWVYANMKILADGAQIYFADDLTIPRLAWFEDERAINLGIDDYSTLELFLHQHSVCRPPESFVAIHTAKMWLAGEYYTTVEPERASVTIKVYNSETTKTISNALVTLKSGAVVVGEKYTDGGSVTFTNVYVGSYTIKVSISGYELLTESIEVIAPAVEYDAYMVPIPVPPLPWWVIPAVVGAIVIGGFVVLARPKMPTAPPIYVVR